MLNEHWRQCIWLNAANTWLSVILQFAIFKVLADKMAIEITIEREIKLSSNLDRSSGNINYRWNVFIRFDNRLILKKNFCEYMIASEIFKRSNWFLYESILFVTVYCDATVKHWYAKLFTCA